MHSSADLVAHAAMRKLNADAIDVVNDLFDGDDGIRRHYLDGTEDLFEDSTNGLYKPIYWEIQEFVTKWAYQEKIIGVCSTGPVKIDPNWRP